MCRPLVVLKNAKTFIQTNNVMTKQNENSLAHVPGASLPTDTANHVLKIVPETQEVIMLGDFSDVPGVRASFIRTGGALSQRFIYLFFPSPLFFSRRVAHHLQPRLRSTHAHAHVYARAPPPRLASPRLALDVYSACAEYLE